MTQKRQSKVRDRPFTSSPPGGGQAIFSSEMVRIGEEEVGGVSGEAAEFYMSIFTAAAKPPLGGGVKNDNLVRIGEEGGGGGGQAEFFGELINGRSLTIPIKRCHYNLFAHVIHFAHR